MKDTATISLEHYNELRDFKKTALKSEVIGFRRGNYLAREYYYSISHSELNKALSEENNDLYNRINKLHEKLESKEELKNNLNKPWYKKLFGL